MSLRKSWKVEEQVHIPESPSIDCYSYSILTILVNQYRASRNDAPTRTHRQTSHIIPNFPLLLVSFLHPSFNKCILYLYLAFSTSITYISFEWRFWQAADFISINGSWGSNDTLVYMRFITCNLIGRSFRGSKMTPHVIDFGNYMISDIPYPRFGREQTT